MNNANTGLTLGHQWHKWAIVGLLTTLILPFNLSAAQPEQPLPKIKPEKARVIEHWTPTRIANAIPRDFVIDARGLGYMKRPGGMLAPYGHSISAQKSAVPMAKPGSSSGSGDNVGPSITGMTPSNGDVIGDTQRFSALVADPSGVKSVSFKLWRANGLSQSYSATHTTGDEWAINFSGFSDGNWFWQVIAKDGAAKRGNTSTSDTVGFTVNTSGGGSSSTNDTVTNSVWSTEDSIKSAAGRIYFEMPGNSTRTLWYGYVCSGTVVTDNVSGRSVIMTAAHCVYDDSNKSFARNVLFIPNQAASGTKTDLNCSNDIMGCWVPSMGVVDNNWAIRTFPNNIAWDYAYYAVDDVGAHQGVTASSDVLDSAAGSLPVSFATVNYNDDTGADYTHALGYSYSNDPNFMYCAEGMTTNGAVNWWLPSCGLSGGASGGPWIQPLNSGSGPIISVNSWGYTSSPGMAGPKLVGTSASCIFSAATSRSLTTPSTIDGDEGYIVTCSN